MDNHCCTGYLFVHFTGESENGEQVYFSVSRNGLHWQDLNGGAPVLVSETGEKGVRDPFIVKSPLDNKYYIIATDLRIASGFGWEAAKTAGSRDLIIWESEDLVHWSGERSRTVGIPGAGCVWAPEAIFDEEKQEFLVFWASNVQNTGEASRKQRIYAAYTKDFREFTEPFLYLERENHVIDTSIIKANGFYFRFSKDETTKRIRMDYSKSLERDTFEEIPSEVLGNLAGVEGPAAFQFNGREEWCLMVDQYATNGGYLPLVSFNLKSGVFRPLMSEEYSMGKNKKRHGSILPVTEEEYQRLVDNYGI